MFKTTVFFSTHFEIQSLSSHKLRNSHPVLSTAWDKFEKVTALPNESGLRGIQLEHFRNGNITCWDDFPPVLFFCLPISAFFIPQTRETHAAQWNASSMYSSTKFSVRAWQGL